MLKKLLTFVYRLIRNHPYLIIFVSFVLAALALSYILIQFNFKTSFLDLLPQNDPLLKEYKKREEVISNTEYLTAVISIAEEEDLSVEERERLLIDIGSKVEQQFSSHPEFQSVQFKRETTIPREYALLYKMDDETLENLQTIHTKLKFYSEPNIDPEGQNFNLVSLYREAHNTLQQMSDSSGDQPSTNLKSSVERFRSLNENVILHLDNLSTINDVNSKIDGILNKIDEGGPQVGEENSTPYFSADRSILLVNAKPRLPSSESVKYCKEITSIAQSKIDTVKKELSVDSVNISLTGPYVINTQTDKALKNDMILTTIISSIGVMTIFFFGFGSLFYAVLIVLPLIMAVLFTMGWAKFSVGGFNLLTSFLPALVLGLGIDYGIHLLVRFREEREQRGSVYSAIEKTILSKGRSTLMAALTTSLVFVSLIFARSQAFVEMGIITGVGILLSFFIYLFLLPALIIVYHERMGQITKFKFFRFHKYLEKGISQVIDKKYLIVGGVAVLTVLAIWLATQINFQFTSTNLAPKVKGIQIMDRVRKQFGQQATGLGTQFVFFPNTESELVKVTSNLKSLDQVKDVRSIEEYLPQNMETKMETISQFQNLGSLQQSLTAVDNNLNEWDDLVQEIEGLIAELSTLQFSSTLINPEQSIQLITPLINQLVTIRKKLKQLDPKMLSTSIASLQEHLTELERRAAKFKDIPPKIEGISNLKDLLPQSAKSMFLTSQNEYIVYAQVKQSIFDSDNLNRFVQQISSFSDDYFGTPLIQYRLEKHMQRDFWFSTLLALIIIGVVLWIGIGSRLESVLAILPLFLGYIWMVGGMKLFGMNFNFINIIISPLLIGIGIDDGIHLIDRWKNEGGSGSPSVVTKIFSRTGTAILATSLTTLAVFGTLLIARTPGLRMLGSTALLGVGFTMLFSLTVLPAALSLAFPESAEYNSERNDR